jgi:hypothetical protein
MTLEEVKDILQADVISGRKLDTIEVELGCGADLMSDVLAFAKSNCLLLTGLTNEQVIRTSEMIDVMAICFVRGKVPPEETVELAKRCGLALLSTRLPMFEACGRLHRAGLVGRSE